MGGVVVVLRRRQLKLKDMRQSIARALRHTLVYESLTVA